MAFVEMEIVNNIFMNEVSLVVHYLGFKPFYDLNQAFFNYSICIPVMEEFYTFNSQQLSTITANKHGCSGVL